MNWFWLYVTSSASCGAPRSRPLYTSCRGRAGQGRGAGQGLVGRGRGGDDDDMYVMVELRGISPAAEKQQGCSKPKGTRHPGGGLSCCISNGYGIGPLVKGRACCISNGTVLDPKYWTLNWYRVLKGKR